MKKGNFIKGMISGLVVGTALGMMLCPGQKKKTCKNVIAGALRSAGDFIESVSSAMGF